MVDNTLRQLYDSEGIEPVITVLPLLRLETGQLQLTDTVDDEEEEPQPVVAHKRARKSGSRRGGKTARAFLGSPRGEDKPWGFEVGDRRSPWWAFGEIAWLWKTDGRVIVSAAAHRSKNVGLHSASFTW